MERALSTRLRLGAAALSLILTSAFVIRASGAVFNDTLTNDANSFAVGNIELTDPQSTGSALFSVSGMVPGDSVTKCINVAYNGVADPSAVKVYTTGYTESGPSNSLATQLDVVITEGSGANGAGDCTNFVAGTGIFNSTLDQLGGDYATGSGVWDPSTASDSKSYQIAVTLNSNTSDTYQGESVTGLNFTWEVQS